LRRHPSRMSPRPRRLPPLPRWQKRLQWLPWRSRPSARSRLALSPLASRPTRLSAGPTALLAELIKLRNFSILSGQGRAYAGVGRSELNFATPYCALRPTVHVSRHRQAVACPRAAQKTATYRSLRSLQWQRWCRRLAQ
jgi:hypothetical protein